MLQINTQRQAEPSICPRCGGAIIYKRKPKAPITRQHANGILKGCETSLRKTYRKRWRHALPDTEHARNCLGVLLRVLASRTDIEAYRLPNKLANVASILMSMTQQAAERLAASIIAGPKYDPCELRGELGSLLGEEIQLTAAEWLDLTLDIRNIVPPVSDTEMAALRKERKLARQRLRRARKRDAEPSRARGRPKLELSDEERAERRRQMQREATRKRRAATGKDVAIKSEAPRRKNTERPRLVATPMAATAPSQPRPDMPQTPHYMIKTTTDEQFVTEQNACLERMGIYLDALHGLMAKEFGATITNKAIEKRYHRQERATP